MPSQPIIFFDLRDTLGALRAWTGGAVLHVYPYMRAVHRELVADGARVGLLFRRCPSCNDAVATCDAMLVRADVADWFAPALRHELAADLDDAAGFAAIRQAHGARCLYVSRDAVALSLARAAGFEPVPHPLLARAVLAGEALRRVEVWGAGAAALVEGVHTPDVVALDLIDPSHVLVIASERGCARLEEAGLRVSPIADDAGASLARIRRNLHTRAGLRQRASDPTACVETRHASYVALEAGTLPARDDAHGAFQLVTADPTLSLGGAHAAAVAAPPARSTWSAVECAVLDAISADAITRDVRALVAMGAAAKGAPGSRHVRHPGNARCVEWSCARFAQLGGLRVARHCFSHAGRALHNVEAELPGDSAEIVIVSAHLDSVVHAFIDPPDPATDPAPGADDDASGVAAVLAIAEAFVRLVAHDRGLRRTLRFVLFNAEEVGMVGSAAYAHDAVLRGDKIVALYQLDMVGYRKQPDEAIRPCEIHIGAFSNPSAEARSVALASWLDDAIDGGLGRSVRRQERFDTRNGDPADRASDHSQFHSRDFPACLVSEDHWSHGADPEFSPNPNYHTANDLDVVGAYVADMARVVAAAAMQAIRIDDGVIAPTVSARVTKRLAPA